MTAAPPAERRYLHYRDKTFIWTGDKATHGIPRLNGMTFAHTKGFWYTRDWDVAVKLARYADSSCAEMLTSLHDTVVAPVLTAQSMSWATDADIDIPAPEGLEYLPFQRAGVAYTLRKFDEGMPGVLIADEPGLGKTIQACGVINARPDIRRVLVVCPASLKINWHRELSRWLVDRRFVGIARDRFPSSVIPVAIVNYDVLHKHERAIKAVEWDLLVADEAHLVKNPETRRAQGLFAIPAKRKLFLSGTPIVNRPAELWTLVRELAPSVFNDHAEYLRRYCQVKVDSKQGRTALNQLQQLLRASCMVRRLKKDVLTDLPDKTRQVIEIPAGTAAQVVRDEQNMALQHSEQMFELTLAVEMSKADPVESHHAGARAARSEEITKAFSQLSRMRHITAVAKVPMTVAHVREALTTGAKVVLFAHHTDVLDAFMEEFSDVAVRVSGGMDVRDRQRSVDAFQKDPNVKLFVGNIQAAGVGLTLTRSSWVMFHELDWVPGNMTQAEDRCHRITQKDAVLVQHIVLEGSLDATMAHTLVEKQKTIDACLDVNEKAELAKDPIVPNVETPATADLTYGRVKAAAATVGPDERAATVLGLRELAALVEGAAEGLNRVDAAMIAAFATTARLSDREVVLARRICRKYRARLTPETRKAIR